MGRISVACKSICIWVRAMYSYHVAKVTKMAPRVERLREVTSDLENARAALERRKVELSEMEEKISHMRSRYENARGAKNSLVQQAEESEIKVKRAERLIGRLEGECARWEKCAGELREKWRGVVGDALLAAGHVAYLGRIPRKLRESQIAEWQEALRNIRLTFSKEFSLLGFCVDQQTVQEWVAAGLPNDRQSLENAVMVKYAQRWVKIADPQNQAAAWLGRRENGRSPAWLAAESADLASSLEEALQKGRGVVVSIEKAGPSELLQSMVRSNGASQEEGERGSRVVHVKNEETAAECLKEVRYATACFLYREVCFESKGFYIGFIFTIVSGCLIQSTNQLGIACSSFRWISWQDDMDTNCVDFSITNDGVYSQLLALGKFSALPTELLSCICLLITAAVSECAVFQTFGRVTTAQICTTMQVTCGSGASLRLAAERPGHPC